jgi:hypothetical protein
MTLRTPAGDTVEVTDTRHFEKRQRTHDLTITGIHAYYVMAGAAPVLVHNCDVALGMKDEGTYTWANNKKFKHFDGVQDWQGPVENAIADSNVRLHVNMKGIPSFTEAAKDGLNPTHPYATDIEMGMIARAVVHGKRSWDSIKFYRPNAKGDLVEHKIPEPDWSTFGRIRPYINEPGPSCGC